MNRAVLSICILASLAGLCLTDSVIFCNPKYLNLPFSPAYFSPVFVLTWVSPFQSFIGTNSILIGNK